MFGRSRQIELKKYVKCRDNSAHHLFRFLNVSSLLRTQTLTFRRGEAYLRRERTHVLSSTTKTWSIIKRRNVHICVDDSCVFSYGNGTHENPLRRWAFSNWRGNSELPNQGGVCALVGPHPRGGARLLSCGRRNAARLAGWPSGRCHARDAAGPEQLTRAP